MPLNDDLKRSEGHMEDAGTHLRDAVKHASDAGGKSVKKMGDAANEAAHHAAAEEEREKRELLGDRLSAGAKANSMAEEAKQRAQASVSGVKRKLDGL